MIFDFLHIFVIAVLIFQPAIHSLSLYNTFLFQVSMKSILAATATLVSLSLVPLASAKAYPGMVFIVNVGADGGLSFFPKELEVRVMDTVVCCLGIVDFRPSTNQEPRYFLQLVRSDLSARSLQIFTPESGTHSILSLDSATSCTPSTLFSSGPLSPSTAPFDYTFTTPGTYHFASDAHCAAGMRGTITVVSSDSLPKMPDEFFSAVPVENVALPDNGVLSNLTLTKNTGMQIPPPNKVAENEAANARATPTTGPAQGTVVATSKHSSSAKLAVGLGGALLAGAIALL